MLVLGLARPRRAGAATTRDAGGGERSPSGELARVAPWAVGRGPVAERGGSLKL